jgi:hypothetical protein
MRTLRLSAATGVVLVAGVIASGISPALADSGPSNPTATHDNPSSCLGAERATRNSNGGDRAQGGFGPAQSAYVASLNDSGQNYGQFLQDWKAAC